MLIALLFTMLPLRKEAEILHLFSKILSKQLLADKKIVCSRYKN